MADHDNDPRPPQESPEPDEGRVEWLHGTLDQTTPEAGPRPRARFPLFSCLTLLAGLLLLTVVLWLLLGPPVPGTSLAAPTGTATPDVAATALALMTREPTTTPYVPEPTATLVPTRSGSFQVGDRVVISGTGERGVRLRAGAGLSFLTLGVANEEDVFFIMPGNGNEQAYPVEADGYLWWRLRSDDGAIGWTVQDFLAPAPLAEPTPTP
jgi:hypothetical protein